MGSRQHKVLRKAAKVDRDELSIRYNQNYGKLVTDRDEALTKINTEYRDSVRAAEDQRGRDRKKVYEEFETARRKMTKEVVSGTTA